MRPPKASPVPPLSANRGEDPLRVCTVCHEEVDPTDLASLVWRECDAKDRPIAGTDALVFLGQGKSHAACEKALVDHPLLYEEIEARPGHFPELCGACTFRSGLACTHPDLSSNGGEGLVVTMFGLGHVVVCMRGGGCHKPIRHAASCVGKKLAT